MDLFGELMRAIFSWKSGLNFKQLQLIALFDMFEGKCGFEMKWKRINLYIPKKLYIKNKLNNTLNMLRLDRPLIFKIKNLFNI